MKNIIFDLDGTLIDSMPVWNGVGKKFLKDNGVEPPEDIEEIFKTMSFEESHRYFAENLGLECSFDHMISSIISMVKDCYANTIPLKPYAYEFLEKEYKKGTNMCILTASEEDYVIPAVKRLGIDKFINGIFTCTGLGMSKSSGEIYDAAAERLGGTAADTAVFEDACHGVVNAKGRGYYTVAVEDESSKDDRDTIIKTADMYIKTYKELI
ncbi:HAD family phosphatase [Anaerotignum faecicola]|nr:HAD family phosphatase [Anaerotignum faecicola]